MARSYAPAMPLATDKTAVRTLDSLLCSAALCAAGSAAVNHLTGWRCPFLVVTGLYCPFCGGTRAVVSLLAGNASLALRDNAAVVVMLALVLVRVVIRVSSGPSLGVRVDSWLLRIDPRVWTTLLMVWTVIRNLHPDLAP